MCNSYLKKIATDLKIPKDISTYYARYSWANIARSLGYSKDLIAEALGHEYGNRVTGIYLDNFDKGIIDEANKKVIEAVFTWVLINSTKQNQMKNLITALANIIRAILIVALFLLVIGFLELLSNPLRFIHHRWTSGNQGNLI